MPAICSFEENFFNNFDIFDILHVFISVTSLISVLTLSLGVFHAAATLVAALIITATIQLVSKSTICLPSFPLLFNILVIGVVLVAVALRLPSFSWVLGGQDQGIYMNMSQFFLDEGRLFFSDKVAERITDVSELDYYITRNYSSTKDQPFLPGIYSSDSEWPQSRMYFQFYSLFPSLLALSSLVFGPLSSSLILILFALLTGVILFKFAYKITGSTTTGLIAFSLYVTNPLAVFFSKFPVSEVVYGYFIIATYYYLSKAHSCKAGIWVVLFVLSSTALFFSHISSFIHVPILLLVISGMFIKKRRFGFQLSAVVLSSYLLSLLYAYHFHHEYFMYQFSRIFSILPNNLNEIGLYSFFLLIFSLVIIFSRKLNTQYFLSNIATYCHNSRTPEQKLSLIKSGMLLLSVIIFCASVINAYTTASASIDSNQFLSIFFTSDTQVEDIFVRSSVINYVIFLNPILFALLVVGLFKVKKELALVLPLMTVLIFSSVLRLLVQDILPYNYYYSRYLLPELVTISILLVAVFTTTHILRSNSFVKKVALASLLGASFVINVTISIQQLKARENGPIVNSLVAISGAVRDDDLIIIDNQASTLMHQIKTPLYFFFAKNVAFANTAELCMLLQTLLSYNSVYLLSSVHRDNSLFYHLDTLTYLTEELEHTFLIPTEVVYKWDDPLFFSKIDTTQLANICNETRTR